MASSNITLSAGVRSNLLSLQNTADLMGRTQNRLATGKKVNTALDNPTNFFTSSALQSRAGEMGALLDNMSSGIKTLEAADNGITAINKTIESMQSTLRQARQDKSYKTGAFTFADNFDTTAVETLSFSGGLVGDTAVAIDLNTTTATSTASSLTATGAYSAPTAGTANSLSTTAAYSAPTAATQAVSTASNAFVAIGAGETSSFDLNGVTITLDDTTGANIAAATAEIQDQIDASALAGDFTVTDDGTNITISGLADGSTSVAITNVVAPASTGDIGFVASTDDSTGTAADDLSFTVNGTAVTVTAAQGATLTDAITEINTDLGASHAFEAFDDGGNLGIREKAASGVALTIGGADSGLFTATTASSGVAGNPLEFTVNGTAVSVTAAQGATLADAITEINTDLGASHAFEAFDDNGNLGIREKVANGAALTIGGTDAASVFGTTLTNQGAGPGVKTVDQLVTEINDHASLAGKVRASNDSGKLRIENLSTQALTVTSSSDDVTDDLGTTNQIAGNTVRANLIDQFNALRDQLNKLADDASFNGVNLLRGDKLKLTFNETGTSTMEIQAKDETGEERPINAATLDIDFALDGDFDVDADIDSRLDTLQTALGTLRSQASAFGSNLSIVQNRTEFTKNMVNTLQTGADALVLADTNEEAANMLALQTRQQLSSTALSLASQADQAVLRLF